MNSVEFAVEKNTACAVFILDPHKSGFPITYCNCEFERQTGYSRDEIVGHPIEHRFLAKLDEEALTQLRSALSEAQDAALVVHNEHKDGTRYRTHIIMSAVRDSSGRLSQIFGVQHKLPDVTERQRAMENAQLFLESAPDATFIIDEFGKLVVTNREAEYLFGYTQEELRSMPIEALMPARYREQHLAHRDRFTANPTVREMGVGMPTVALTKSGAELPVDIRLSPIKADGKQFFSASVRDISAHVDIENKLAEARDMAERATAEKSRFLAAASHDLRQPLQAISLYLSVLGRIDDPVKRKEVSTKMQLSLDNINSMISTLLDVSKLDSGAIKPEKTEVRVQKVLDKIMAGSLQQANEKGLTLKCCSTQAVVYTDPALLERVIDNFVTNAIRYTNTGSVSMQCRQVDRSLVIEVSDTGIGIDHNQLDQVFEEYYQLGNPMRNRNKGLGLGLSIVKHIARLLGHTIDVQSEVGRGSTFSISVPLVRTDSVKTRDEGESEAGEALADTGALVLLVDDDPDVLDSTRMLLDLVGIEVVSGADSSEAFDHLDAGVEPVMIISDFRLPGMNGIDFINEARKRLQADVPAIIMTGDTATQRMDKSPMPYCEVVHKPVDSDRMLELIKNTISARHHNH